MRLACPRRKPGPTILATQLACQRMAPGYNVPVTETRQTTLYFFPEEDVTESELRSALTGQDRQRQAWAISHLLKYAQWEDIFLYTSRNAIREIFAELDLPENLRVAWGRMLKIETPVA